MPRPTSIRSHLKPSWTGRGPLPAFLGCWAAWCVCALALGVMVFADSTAAQERVVPGTRSQMMLSFAPIVSSVAPAVVNVYAQRSRRQQTAVSPFLDDPFFERFFGRGGVPEGRAQSSLGSGVIVSQDGLIVTNNHVIQNADQIRVALTDRREYDCDILLRDERTDLAVLKIRGAVGPFPTVEFGDSDLLEVGDIVLAIGNPFGVGQTVTQGIVSALARTEVGVTDYQFFIQTDAAINPGNSGGALIGMDGKLIGINTAIYSRSGGSNGIGFAIPANMVRIVAQAARTGDIVRRPWIGATFQIIDRDLANSLGLDRPVGALIANTVRGGPAEAAGLVPGDVIVGVDGIEVSDPQTLSYRVATKGIGSEALLNIIRNGREVSLTLPLLQAPETVPRDQQVIVGRSPFQGAQVANLSPAVAEEVRVAFDREGVVVVGIEEASSAQTVGLERGDIILDVNGIVVGTTSQLQSISNTPQPVWRITIDRGGRLIRMAFRG